MLLMYTDIKASYKQARIGKPLNIVADFRPWKNPIIWQRWISFSSPSSHHGVDSRSSSSSSNGSGEGSISYWWCQRKLLLLLRRLARFPGQPILGRLPDGRCGGGGAPTINPSIDRTHRALEMGGRFAPPWPAPAILPLKLRPRRHQLIISC